MLNFCKAFDTVAHNRLLNKLKFYGIQGNIYDWLSIRLTQRTQWIVLDGFSYNYIKAFAHMSLCSQIIIHCIQTIEPSALEIEPRSFQLHWSLYCIIVLWSLQVQWIPTVKHVSFLARYSKMLNFSSLKNQFKRADSESSILRCLF